MKGWIKLHRKMKEWEWYNDITIRWVFIDCLLSANHEDREWQWIKIPTGSFITSIDKLAKSNNISIQKLRTILRKINKQILTKSTNKYTMITVVKYCDYQNIEIEINKQSTNNPTNEQQTNNKQLTTNKNIKNNKNEKNIRNKEINIDMYLFWKSENWKQTFIDFLETRENLKKWINTQRALTILVNKLNTIANNQNTQVLIMENSIMNWWQWVFPMKEAPPWSSQKEITIDEMKKMQEARNNAAKEVAENNRFKMERWRSKAWFLKDISEYKEKTRFNPNN